MVTTTAHASSRPHSPARTGCSSTRWSTRRSAAAWAASCTPCNSSQRFPTEFSRTLFQPGPTSMSDSNERISQIVSNNDVVLFMKGTPLFPQCGFSSRAVAILDHCGVAYESVDVLQDMEIRQGIKAFSEWPTIPQLYVKGEFVGGSDIMMEMYQAGELQQLLDEKQVAKAQ